MAIPSQLTDGNESRYGAALGGGAAAGAAGVISLGLAMPPVGVAVAIGSALGPLLASGAVIFADGKLHTVLRRNSLSTSKIPPPVQPASTPTCVRHVVHHHRRQVGESGPGHAAVTRTPIPPGVCDGQSRLHSKWIRTELQGH